MNYKQIIDFLYSQLATFHRTGADAYHANLDITLKLMDLFDHPYHEFRSIHIAGTNGKGSVSNMLASILQTAGYRTGLYTSPHLKDFRERIRVGGKMVPRDYVIHFVKNNKEIFDELKPSFFEMTTAMAFCYFKEEKVDFAVIETGLGGRLDSTNVITPVLSVITNIGKDHTDLLGNTLEKIAFEKAGIIKYKTPVVMGKIKPGLRSVIDVRAASLKAPVYYSEDRFRILKAKIHDEEDNGLLLKAKSSKYIYNIVCPLKGSYQKENILTALQACEVLNDLAYPLNATTISKGLKHVTRNTGFKGRWQVIGKKPLIVCDAGHNEDGIRIVMNQLKSMDYHQLHIVFGMVKDKDISAVLKLLPRDATYYFCKPKIPRGLDENILLAAGKGRRLNGSAYPSVREALDNAKKNAAADDIIFVGGSSFVVAEVV